MAGTALAPGKVRGKATSAMRGHRSRIALVNAVPVTVFLLVLFVYPIIGVLSLSLKGDNGAFTLHWYTDALSGTNLSVLMSTIRISAETAVLSLLVGFVLAHAIARMRPVFAALAMLIVVVPHFISALVRTYGWIIMLGEHGIINTLLTSLHVPGAPFSLLYNETGVVIGTTSVMLPYTVLVLQGVMRGVDSRLLAAAAGFGASRFTIFTRIYLPLVAPGVGTAGLLSFILCLGYYITPALMGGDKQTVVAALIDQQVMKQDQWNSAAAFGVILLLLTFAGLGVLGLAKLRRKKTAARRSSS
ncbi:putative spermidine/putrescine transport system permease protein [Streptomyces luteogriseus]|uniref:ABC transporter permease n=1 Tax=Streptomyces luteogriseus TaxID=68233 RepID=UPI002787F8D7|nr:ABC transporter permease [Streptomyces luteogriseus]MDQ0718388.1 putative spermidine/putrescine transport system permease protein [Streptomyces luteogriseus]